MQNWAGYVCLKVVTYIFRCSFTHSMEALCNLAIISELVLLCAPNVRTNFHFSVVEVCFSNVKHSLIVDRIYIIWESVFFLRKLRVDHFDAMYFFMENYRYSKHLVRYGKILFRPLCNYIFYTYSWHPLHLTNAKLPRMYTIILHRFWTYLHSWWARIFIQCNRWLNQPIYRTNVGNMTIWVVDDSWSDMNPRVFSVRITTRLGRK